MKYLLLPLLFIIAACNSNPHHPHHGQYHVELDIGNGHVLPFTANFVEDHSFEFNNAEETVETLECIIRGDSIIIEHPVYEGTFKGTFTATEINGSFIKESLNRTVPFRMIQTEAPRFEVKAPSKFNISGNWETVFSPDDNKARYFARGEFQQNGSKVTGTFRTTTGDYRYLEGIVDGDTLKLSTFDMAHAFLFVAEVTDSTLVGTFYSGNHFEEPFTAVRNERYELPEPDSLTYLKEGYERISFQFPDTNGEIVSFDDERFTDKVVVVQIMGSWCPNCLDESRFLADYYRQYETDDLEIVALAFEYKPTAEKATDGLRKLKSSLGIEYPVLLAQYGSEDKTKAGEKLPMLNHIISYPTTLFIDKTGRVRRIHTGFNGPATGEKYDAFKSDFEAYISLLTSE